MIFSTLAVLIVLSVSHQASAVPAKSLLSKRLSGIICDPINPTIKPVARSQVQFLIDGWETFSSPTITTVRGGEETILVSTLITTLDDHKETAVLYYNNVGFQDIVVTIKAPDGDSLLNAANQMINKCWGTDKDKDKDRIASAQLFFGEGGNNVVIRKRCSPLDKDEWTNCN